MASLSWIRDLDNAIFGGTGQRLAAWVPADGRQFSDPLGADEADNGVLSIVMDQLQTQWCAAWFLTYKLGAQMHFFFGPIHRRHNDLNNGLAKAGFFGVCLMRLFELNISYGPWANGANFNQLREQALDLVQAMDPENPILLRLWPMICADRGWYGDEAGAAARTRYIQELTSMKVVHFKGIRASPQRWCSLVQAMAAEDGCFHDKLLLLVTLCCRKGWAAHIDDLYTPSPRLLVACGLQVGGVPHAARLDDALMDVPAASSSSSAQPAPAPKAKAKAGAQKAKGRTEARESISKVVRQSTNMLHACVRVMCDPNLILRSRAVVHVTKPLIDEHSWCTHTLRDGPSTLQYYIGEATYAWLGALVQVLKTLANLPGLGRCGLTVEFQQDMQATMLVDSADVAYEDGLADGLWRICTRTIAERCASCMVYTGSYPYLMAKVASEDVVVQASGLAMWGRDWAAFERGHTAGLPSVLNLVAKHPFQQRAMQDATRIARASGFQATPELRRRCRLIFTGLGSDKLVEDANKVVRDSENRSAPKKVLKGYRIWEAPIGHGVLAQYGRAEVQSNSRPMILSEQKRSLFQAVGNLPEGAPDYKRILGTQDWATFDATSLKKLPAMVALLRSMSEADDWSLSSECWRSSVVPEHQVILQTDSGGQSSLWYCMYKCEYGVLPWPVVRRADGSMLLDWGVTELTWKVITSLDSLQVVPYTVASPLHLFLEGKVVLPDIAIAMKAGEPLPMIAWLAHRGFPGVCEAHLRKLHIEYGIVSQDTDLQLPLEDALAMQLVEDIIPDLTAEDMQRAMLARHSLAEAFGGEDPWEFIEGHDIEEVCSTSDKKFLKGEHDRLNKLRRERQDIHEKIVAVVSEKFAKKGPVQKRRKVNPPGSAKRGSLDRWWASVPGDPAFVEAHMPPGARISTDHWCGRFKVAYHAKSKSVSWTTRGMPSAGLECLRVLWEWHTERTGEAPPFSLATVV